MSRSDECLECFGVLCFALLYICTYGPLRLPLPLCRAYLLPFISISISISTISTIARQTNHPPITHHPEEKKGGRE